MLLHDTTKQNLLPPIIPLVAVVVRSENQLAVSEEPNESVIEVKYFYTIHKL
jgi:hypothetical protein